MDSVFAENSLCAMYIGKENDDNENEEEGGSSSENTLKCIKIPLRSNIAAYLQRKELGRSIEPMSCNNNLIDKVTSNYIIAKQIISNLPWQEKLICKLVCSTWHSAVQALQREQLSPEDFVIDMVSYCWNSHCGSGWFKQSGIFHTEPLVIFTFANTAGYYAHVKCKTFMPCPCENPCRKEHCCKLLFPLNIILSYVYNV